MVTTKTLFDPALSDQYFINMIPALAGQHEINEKSMQFNTSMVENLKEKLSLLVLKMEHAQEIHSLRKSHANEIDLLKCGHLDEVVKLKEMYAIDSGHLMDTRDLMDTHDQNEEIINALLDQNQALTQQVQMMAREMDDIKEKYKTEVENLRKNVA